MSCRGLLVLGALVLLGLAGCAQVRSDGDDLFRDRVLPPWTDLTVEADTVRVWNRSFRFDAGPVPVSITSAGQELLAGPADLTLEVDGQSARWSAGAISSAGPVRWVRVSEAAAGGLTARATTTVEYDGFCRVDLELTPAAQPTLQRLELSIPLRPEVAELYTQNIVGTERLRSVRWDLRRTPDRQWWAGTLPAAGMTLQFTPQLWLGNTARGLAWCAESPADWRPVNAPDAITVTPSPAATTLTVRMVSQPGPLTAPLNFSFALVPTPVKPWREDLANTRLVHSAAGNGPEDFRARLLTPGVYAEEPIISDLRDQVTLAAWVWPLETGNGFIFHNDGLALRHSAADGKLIFTLGDGAMGEHTLEAQVPLQPQQWQHLACTYDGATMRIFLNATQVAERPEGFAFRVLPSRPACVGASNAANALWRGRLDELALLRRALGPDEIAALMQGALPEAAAVAGFWRFDTPPTDLIVTDDGPHHLAMRLRSKRPAGLQPVWTEGVRGQALELDGYWAEITGNRANRTGLEQLKAEGVDVLLLWNNWSDIWGYPGVTSPEHKAFLHELLAAAHQVGIKVIPYTSVAILMENQPEYAAVASSVLPPDPTPFERRGIKGYRVEKNQAWAEYFARKLADLVREFDFDGVYLDGCGLGGTVADEVPEEGGGGVVRYSVYGGRELMRRIACVFHDGLRADGIILAHDSSPFICSQDGFADLIFTGELHYWLVGFRNLAADRGAPVAARWPPDLMRAWYTPETYGVPMRFVAKLRDLQFNDGERKAPRGAILPDDELIAATAVHGIPPMSTSSLLWPTGLDRPWWAARDLLGRDGATWHPYWERSNALSAEPKGIIVSYFQRAADRAVLLVIANMGESATTARVAINAPVLGATRWLVQRTLPDWLSATIEEDAVSVPLASGQAAFVLLVPAGPQ